MFSHDRDIYLIQFTAESAPNLQTTSRKRPRFAGRSGYEMRESTIMKRRSGGDGIQTPRVRCTPTKRVPEGGQDSALRRVLRTGLTVGQCPVVVL